MLFHVSEHGGIEGFELRRADEWSEPRVWAIDDDRLRNYVVPRDSGRRWVCERPIPPRSDFFGPLE